MKMKFPATVMVLDVVSNFSLQSSKVTADIYFDVLREVVVLWMKQVANEHHFIFQHIMPKRCKNFSVSMFLSSGQRIVGAYVKEKLINLIPIKRLLN